MIDELRTIFQDGAKKRQMSDSKFYKQVSADSGVGSATFTGWFKGKTRRPQHATVMAAARALGYDYKLVNMTKKKK